MLRFASASVAVAATGAGRRLGRRRRRGGPPTGAELAALSAAADAELARVAADLLRHAGPVRERRHVERHRRPERPDRRHGLRPADTGYYHGGDLKGLTEHLQRIKDLGFTALWVTPVLKQDPVENGSAAYHGYWGLDFTTVDPHLGTDQDFTSFVGSAHGLGLKVYLDVVVNHTADVIQLTNGGDVHRHRRSATATASASTRRTYVTSKHFPCLRPPTCREVPLLLTADSHLKKPEWLNDPLNYHDRGNIDFGSCSQQCFEQGDFYGLDDLFTEKPNVLNGLAQIYSSWITRFHVDGFRVDTAKHVNAAFFKLWVPKIRAAARSVGIADFPIFGEVTLNDAVDLSAYVRDRGLPQVLDFPFQQVATGVRGRRVRREGHRRTGSRTTTTSALPNGVDPAFPTFLGNHDMGRGGAADPLAGPRARRRRARSSTSCSATTCSTCCAARPTLLYGDEVGMIGSGGDKAAREDMFPTQVSDWQTEPRVGSPPIGKGSSFDVTDNPIERSCRSCRRSATRTPRSRPARRSCATRSDAVLVVSRIDFATGREVVTAFNNGDTAAKVTVRSRPRARPGRSRSAAERPPRAAASLTIPPVSALVAVPAATIPAAAPAAPKLKEPADPLTSYDLLSATVPGAPVSVTFALRRQGGAWQRLAIDDSAPYRAFVDPTHYPKHERLDAVAVARALDGSVSVSPVMTFTANG